MTNPFEDADLRHLVLANDARQHSLWPAFATVPDGWDVVHGPADRQECLEYVTAHWTDMRPGRPHAAPGGGTTGGTPSADGPAALFEARAARNPDAVAVLAGDTRLTYAQLDARVNALARNLAARGVGPEDLVALMLPRSAELVVALLAVLRCGAAYVPLDPDYPADRIAHVLADAAPALLLTTAEPAAGEPTDGIPRLLLSGQDVSGADVGPFVPDRPVLPWHPAYVIYTSGSTGRPKGVVVTRGSLLNFLIAMRERFALTPTDRLVAVTTIAFDIAALEICLPLASGASVVMAPADVVRDPLLLSRLVDRSGATTLQATPSLWQALVSEHPNAVRGLRMLVGGEALPAALGERLRALGSGVTNLYGPTETTIWSTAQEVDGSARPASIGRPIRRTRVHVLDEELRPVPPGVAAELYLAGDGLARGYLNRPDLTAERFVADPSGPRGTRMYRTGDLVRQGADGSLEYLSRVDFQVKVRGFRVELAEIEDALSAHGGVARAAVTVREDSPGDARLVGHVIPAAGQVVSPAALRTFAARALPDYMVPSVIAVREVFPLTPNGKLDRRALTAAPMPPGSATGAGEPLPHDDSPLGAVAASWQDVLGIPVPDGRGFAELGGTSLGAARAAARLRELTGRSVSVADVLGAASAGELAAVVAAAPPHENRPVPPGAGRTSAPLSADQRAIWMHDQLDPDPLLYLETYCLELGGDVDTRRLADAVRKAALCHPAVGAAVESRDGEPVLSLGAHRIGLTLRAVPPGRTRSQLLALVRAEAARPIPLGQGPLLRCVLFRVPDGPSMLLLAWHHLVMDGWGLRLLLHDLERFHNDPAAVPAVGRITLCDLNAWRNESAADPATDLALTRAVADLLPAVRAAQTAEPAEWSAGGHAEAVELTVPDALAHRVESAAATAGHTPFIVVCAAYRRALAAVLGVQRPLLAVAVSGRRIPESEGIVGCFTNTVLLDCGRVPEGPAVLDRTRDAFDQAVAAQEHLPFPRLVKGLRERARLPVDFPRLYLSMDDEPAVRFEGMVNRSVPVTPDRAKFDVTMSLLYGPGRLSGRLEYRTSLLASEDAGQLVKAFTASLADLAGAGGQAR
ncbi:non-ribosomal peptide synthetase [Streptomyces solincola]|uniref:non-ribosomal peptide synthetase n=1 Tax=Streptomyces solincola TaxID=2100817 RepID=UPI0015E333A2|nr:non-ribosomal peptide synthetase [Streptomyces solincola]